MTEQVNGVAVIPAADLSDFMPADVAELEIVGPDGIKSTGWKIMIAGPSHAKTVAWGNENSRRALRRQAQIEQAQVNGRKYRAPDRDPDDVRAENVEFVVARILDWTPIRIASIQVEPITFTPEMATKLLGRPDMGWAFAQMIEFIASERSFSKASASN